MKPPIQRRLIALAVFAAVGTLPFLASWWVSGRVDAQQACSDRCAQTRQEGHMVYKGPWTPKDAYRQMHAECECR